MNSTLCASRAQDDPLCLLAGAYPFYYSPTLRLIESVPDSIVTLAAIVIAYWVASLFFHMLDMSDWRWLDKYRIHPSEEVSKRNMVTRAEVIWAVIIQQVIQTAMGLAWLSDEAKHIVDHAQELQRLVDFMQPAFAVVLGHNVSPLLLARTAHFVYWWGIPGAQLLFAMFIIDTWQYTLHRTMHVNKFLYKHLHSWHHRLYVPYAFGALYNHPVEGFLLDSLGALIAEWASGMSIRQAMFLFTVSTLKTVDDHCGYSLPWDPLQMITSNNADYHDIHHQVIGIKSNFAQPFFVHWDALLGTRMTREDIERRRTKAKKAL
ncbi:hypothetical protein D9619_006163 [Psilocybe cf. subviscida]|uniref:Fatty acid hydroxylase domain-containing protein n=1 Tax=Psilocybe cf. subviscida TaxID=2480587 RepID=A0A8H5EY19_9AGAR|nr:hypothetical protein D9619_006163 [Psilocybe cf. subviscida]